MKVVGVEGNGSVVASLVRRSLSSLAMLAVAAVGRGREGG